MIYWRHAGYDVRGSIREGLAQVGVALRDPEAFALRVAREPAAHGWFVWAALAVTAVTGTATYGLTMGLLFGPREMFERSVLLTVGAGLAWVATLPTLYVLNSLSGSRLSAATTLLAALVTTSWGALAMLASIPINWFFTVAFNSLPFDVDVGTLVLIVNLVIFTGVGVSMINVFGRVMRTLEPERGRRPTWALALVTVLGCELFWALGLFQFQV